MGLNHYEKIRKEFLKKNKKAKIDETDFRADGRLEWYCKHGVGHTVYSPDNNFVHGCDGCCKNIKTLNTPLQRNARKVSPGSTEPSPGAKRKKKKKK